MAVACDSDGTDFPTTDLATTTTQAQTSTTRPQLVNGGLIAVDPATLIPLEGSDAVLVGDGFEGVASPNGAIAAVVTQTTSPDKTTVSIVEVATGSVMTTVEAVSESVTGLTVDDDGTALWLGSFQDLVLYRLESGGSRAEALYDDFPTGFASQSFQVFPDGRIGLVGTSPTEGEWDLTSVVMVSPSASDHVQIKLPSVMSGFLDESPDDDSIAILEYSRNAAVWDVMNDRLLLVEAARDVVTEVDLSNGEVSEHPFSLPESLLSRLWMMVTPKAQAKGPTAGTERAAVLTPDGLNLIVASSIEEAEVIDPSTWETTRIPQVLMVLSVATWDATGLDIVADSFYPSPDGRHLLAQGTETSSLGEEFSISPSPVYVIDMLEPNAAIAFQTSETSDAAVQFSVTGAFAYLQTFDETETKIDVLDMELRQLTGAVAFREISLIGPAGMMAFHFD